MKSLRIALVLLSLLFVHSVAFAQAVLIPTDERIAPLRLSSHRVDVEIRDNAARTRVTNVFRNDSAQQLEATFYFAVPKGAATTDFALWMNGERIRGEVLPKEKAKEIYESIVRRMRDPGLLEYVDAELFQARIFPVPANGDQKVEIEYAAALSQNGDTLHYRYPLNRTVGSTGTFVMSGRVESRHPITQVWAPRQAIDVSMDGSRRATFGIEQPMGEATDVDVYVSRAGDDVGFSLLTHEPGSKKDGFFMLTVAASPELQRMEVMPKHVTFVVDTSGSMSGDKIVQARRMLEMCVRELNREDTFNIIRFSTSVTSVFERPQEATSANLDRALEFVAGLQAAGNTNISGALERALSEPVDATRPSSVIFVTDGLPTEGETEVGRIIDGASRRAGDGGRRVFTFGVGYDVNTRLLDGLARRIRGQSGYVRPNEDMAQVVTGFYAKVSSPIMANVEIDFGGVDVSQVYPNPIPDLYRDQPIVVFGRFEHGKSTEIRVRGRVRGETMTLRYGASFADESDGATDFVANLWAHRRVSDLLARIQEEGEKKSMVDEVVSLATEYGIVTPYTSYLALDPSERHMLEQERPTEPMAGGSMRDEARQPMPSPPPSGGPRRTSANDFDSSGAGRGGYGAPSSSSGLGSAPAAADAAPRAPRAESGRAAVEESIERRRSAEKMQVEADTSRRSVAGRSFARSGGIWIESGLESRSATRRVSYLSRDYFQLLEKHPKLADVLALGERVRFRLDGEIVEIVP